MAAGRLGHAGIDDPVAALVLGAPRRVELLLVGGRAVVEGAELRTGPTQALAARPRAPEPAPARDGPAAPESPMSTAETTTLERADPSARRRHRARPSAADGVPKVKGEFAYSSDMRVEGMLCGATLRSPHPRARISGHRHRARAGDPRRARRAHPRGRAGRKTYGMEIPDQPVLAIDQVRYQGEPVAIVAADHPETARRAAAPSQSSTTCSSR